jgi:hypothetical protein
VGVTGERRQRRGGGYVKQSEAVEYPHDAFLKEKQTHTHTHTHEETPVELKMQ